MLAEENELLTKVGPGTLMGNLLRRYWTPACLIEEVPIADSAPVRVRLLGENLVAFRDSEGKVGLVGENCPHRGASLFFGRNEECGLRCVYHGWKYDRSGQCVDIPSEPEYSRFYRRVKVKSYPTHESGGIVWTYMGPIEDMPPFRDFGTESLTKDQVFAAKLRTTCNWIQTMDGNVDTVHISFLHQYDAIDDIPDDGTDRPGYPSNAMSMKFWRHDRRPRIEVEDTWYGFRYAGIRTTPNSHTHARVSAFILPYSTLVANVPFSTRHLMVVPIDDENCFRYSFTAQPSTPEQGIGGPPFFMTPGYPYDQRTRGSGIVPRDYNLANDFQVDRASQRSGTFSGIMDFVSQDLMVTESMGPIYDRTEENLASTDRAIVRMRTLLLEAARALAEGHEPPASGVGDYREIRSAEKILEPGEDWRLLGTDQDPIITGVTRVRDPEPESVPVA